MDEARQRRWRLGSMLLAVTCLVMAGIVAWSIFARRGDTLAGTAPGDTTASIDTEPHRALGPSGLPLPRFVSLKADKVNVRRGPSSDHAVAWVFQRKGLPVEIVAEFENWRRIRDSDGEEGWILQNLLTGKRTAVIAPWKLDLTIPLHDAPGASSPEVAKLTAGVLGDIDNCNGTWCEVTAGGFDGWVEQTQIWGAYPGEKVN
jgi:SH3-like domain-containing protein